MKIAILLGCVAFWAGVIAVVSSLTGCASLNPEGFEIGGKIGMYAVQDRQVSETTSVKKRPFICNFRNCDDAGNVIQGS